MLTKWVSGSFEELTFFLTNMWRSSALLGEFLLWQPNNNELKSTEANRKWKSGWSHLYILRLWYLDATFLRSQCSAQFCDVSIINGCSLFLCVVLICTSFLHVTKHVLKADVNKTDSHLVNHWDDSSLKLVQLSLKKHVHILRNAALGSLCSKYEAAGSCCLA